MHWGCLILCSGGMQLLTQPGWRLAGDLARLAVSMLPDAARVAAGLPLIRPASGPQPLTRQAGGRAVVHTS